ncbi:MAG TPA: LuxR C-terminal-related transcriptional regulator [Arachnia sp.]|nr:LuxR C-terminal-related transcriptional regulator [Arachnia sp.]HMT86272.1 LuxR C-terminal-related transcriptional regulator [Arachnia sp.]
MQLQWDGRGSRHAAVAYGGAPITVIVAPAGFGKSTLIHAWRSEASSDAVTAVGSFDTYSRSNALDAGLVLIDVARALGVAEPALRLARAQIRPDGAALGAAFIGALGDELAGLSLEFVCFLDDLHTLPSEVVDDIGRLISAVADDSHRFVVASRTEPPWVLGEREADLVRADDLRLTSEDIANLLSPGFACMVPRALEITGGWAAAVETVRWRLQATPTLNLEDAVLDLVDYVAAEVLPALDPQAMRVLTRTSILEAFPVSVATAVSGDPAAARILDEFGRRTSLITCTEDGTHRYHSILHQALRKHLTLSEPEVIRELHIRAADAWLAEPSSFEAFNDAVGHLIEARSWNRVLPLLRERAGEFNANMRLELLVHWLDLIPGARWRGDRALLLHYALANLRIGRTAIGLKTAQSLQLDADPIVAAVASLLYVSAIAWTSDHADALRVIEEILPRLRELDTNPRADVPAFPGTRGYELGGLSLAAASLLALGRFEESLAVIDRVLPRRDEITPLGMCGVLGVSGWALAMRGDVAAARAHAREALQIAAQVATPRHMRRITPLLALAVCAAVTGDCDEAMSALSDAVELCRSSRMTNLLRLADMVGAMCGVPDSFLTDDDRAIAAATGVVDDFAGAAEARRRARLGDFAGAERQLDAIEPREHRLSAWVEVLLHGQDRRWVGRWVARLPQPIHPFGRVVRLLAEAATAEEDAEASRLVEEAAEVASDQHLVGLLLDAPEQLWERVDPARFDQAPFDKDSASHALLAEVAARLARPVNGGPLPAFTARELEVLRLLPYVGAASGLAERLYISSNTAKWHLANIYRKLDVGRQQEAVVRGVELGLITAR